MPSVLMTLNTKSPIRVALLTVPESTPMALYGLHEILGSVGFVWPMLTGEKAEVRQMKPELVSAAAQPVLSANGLMIEATAPLGAADIVIVADLALQPDCDPRGRWPVERAWLRERQAAGSVICSVCTGSVMLAEAGILDGIDATTHWAVREIFARHYGKVRLCPERILVPAGDEDRIVTGGGVGAWEDLALYLIARFVGRAEAVRIAKVFLLGDRCDGQLPFARARRSAHHDDRIVADAQAWIADHYMIDQPVSALVARSGLPERTFKRRFRVATGYTAIEYVQTVRIEEAKQLLETTNLPSTEVAANVGYEDATFFRRLFKRQAGVTPARYRRRFAGIGQIQGV